MVVVSRPTPEQVEAIAPDWLSFLRADDWGRTWKHPPMTERLDDEEQYVHHTAGNEYRYLSAADAMRTAQVFAHSKGYASVGYDTMVHGDRYDKFTVCGGREGFRSAATKDRNELGEATCAFGYFHPGHSLSAHPRPRMVEAIAWSIAWSIAHGWTHPDAVVRGHRDNPSHPNATGCPGDYLYPHIPTIAARALEIVAQAAGDIDDMTAAVLYRDPRYIGTYLLGAGVPLILTPALKDHYQSIGVPEVVDEHDELLANLELVTGYTPRPKG